MTRERIGSEHEIEREVQFCVRNLPCYKRALRKVGRQQRLTDPSNRPGLQHCSDSIQNCSFGDSGEVSYFTKRFTNESLNFVFGNSENSGVDGISVFCSGHSVLCEGGTG